MDERVLLRRMAIVGSSIGFALVALASLEWLAHPLDEIVRDIGLAFLVSTIIGVSYEWFIRTRLLEDTLKVALGYILPSELKGEVRALYEIPFMCTRHIQTMRLNLSSNPELVVLHMKLERTLKNVTSHRQKLPVSTSVCEWFFDGLSSRIIDIGAVQGEKRWEVASIGV